MGDGRNLKEILLKKGITVKELSKATGLKTTTLYSIIQKDSKIKFDYGLRIANVLNLHVNDICSGSPFSGDLTEDEVDKVISSEPGDMNKTRVKDYLLNTTYPLFNMLGTGNMPGVDKLLNSFFRLDDVGRKEFLEHLEVPLKYHEDPKRTEEISKIKGW